MKLILHIDEPERVRDIVARRHPDVAVALCRDYASMPDVLARATHQTRSRVQDTPCCALSCSINVAACASKAESAAAIATAAMAATTRFLIVSLQSWRRDLAKSYFPPAMKPGTEVRFSISAMMRLAVMAMIR